MAACGLGIPRASTGKGPLLKLGSWQLTADRSDTVRDVPPSSGGFRLLVLHVDSVEFPGALGPGGR